MTWANDAIGVYLDNIYNDPLIGPKYFVTKAVISSDLSVVQYTVSVDLNTLLANCAAFGVAMSSNAAARIYTFPISYIEQNPQGAYVQYTQSYSVTVPTTGVASVASSTFYP